MSSPEKPAPNDSSAAFSTAVTVEDEGLGAVVVVLASLEDIIVSNIELEKNGDEGF